MSRVRSVITVWSVVTVATLVLAACGSSSSGSKSTKSSTSSSTKSGSGSQDTTAATTAKSSSSASSSASISCDRVSPAEINSALGVTVGAPTVTDNPPVTVCTYKRTSGVGQVLVRFETGMDDAGWEASKSGFGQHGEPTQDLSGLGDKAFTSTIGSGQFVENTVVTQKGSTNLLITASGASLAQVEGLARQILTSL